MKTPLRSALVIASFLLGVSVAGASDSVRVQSSQQLRILVVDATKHDAAHVQVHDSFSACLSASLQRQCGGAVSIRIADQASTDGVATALKNGDCDAALVFEDTLPSDLRTTAFASKQGVSEMGVPVRTFHLVLRKDDPALAAMLTTAFAETVKAPAFQQALGRSAAVHVVASALR